MTKWTVCLFFSYKAVMIYRCDISICLGLMDIDHYNHKVHTAHTKDNHMVLPSYIHM